MIVSISLPDAIINEVKKVARNRGATFSGFVRLCIEKELKVE